jgi:hypothetical protein
MSVERSDSTLDILVASGLSLLIVGGLVCMTVWWATHAADARHLQAVTDTLADCQTGLDLYRGAAERCAEHVERLRRDCGKEKS